MLLGLPKQILARVSRRLLDPAEVLRQLGVEDGWQVLEMGNPVGFFAAALHTLVGDAGRIIIAGPTEQSLEKLHDEAGHPHTQTALLSQVIAGQAASPHSLDLILLTNAFSNTLHTKNFCLNLSGYLKPTGKLAVLDWDAQDHRPEVPTRAVNREDAIRLLQQCGLQFEHLLELASTHFGLVFTPQLS